MGLKCQINFASNGEAIVTNQDGSFSALYRNLLDKLGNQSKALTYWAVANSDEFQHYTDKTEATATVEDVEMFVNLKKVEDRKLKPEELLEVKNIAAINGFESVADLYAVLNNIFKVDGKYGINRQAAVSSGLYTIEDLDSLDFASVINMMQGIENQIRTNPVFVNNESNKAVYKDSSKKTKLGTKAFISEIEIDQEILRNAKSVEDIPAAILALPYTEFVERFRNDTAFRNKVMSGFEGIRSVPNMTVVDGNLTQVTNDFSVIKNTLLTDLNPVGLEAEVEYLESIDEDIWLTQQDAVIDVLKEVEQDLVEMNVDVVGLSAIAGSRSAVIETLTAIKNLAENPTSDAAIMNFAEVKAKHLGTAAVSNQFIKTDNYLSGMTIVKFDTNKSVDEVFEQFGLIALGNGIYHQPQKYSKSELYTYLMQKYQAGKLSVSKEFLTGDTLSLQDMERFVNSLNTGFNNNEIIALYKLAFDHPISLPSPNIANLATIKTNPGYLAKEFVTDFYNYILNEKARNTDVYTKILSQFTINDGDISLVGQVASIEGIDFEQELKDYIKLKKDTSMDYLLGEDTGFVDEDYVALNTPEKLVNYSGQYNMAGDYAILPNTSAEFLRINGTVYRKVGVRNKTAAFAPIKTKANNLYLLAGKNFAVDTNEVSQILKQNELANEPVTLQAATAAQEQTKTPFKPESLSDRDLTILISNYLSSNLGWNINIMTETNMLEEVRRRGYSDLNAMVEAWHGTPHSFDKFTTDKIGTGEGAQAFGWGLYFTDLEGIAKSYAVSLSTPNFNRFRMRVLNSGLSNLAVNDILDFSEYYDYDYDKIINALVKNENEEGANYLKENKDLFNSTSRNLYKVSLHKGKTPSEYTWLEWDKPLNKQRANELISKLTESQKEQAFGYGISGIQTEGEFYKKLANALGGNLRGGDKNASIFLLENGVDGIKYPAESISRGATSDTARGFNYVVFDENAITIEERLQFLQEGQRVYGFYDPTTKEMYMTEEYINSNTLVHESWHMYKPMVKEAALNGEPGAQALLQAMNTLASELFNEEEFNQRYDEFIGATPTALNFSATDFQFATDSDFIKPGKLKPEVQEEIRKERQAIEDEAKANGTWLKAPNGKDTNLNPNQWVTVRTNRFKNWFGDWENSPSESSQVTDTNGEPKVMYTGTSKDKDFDKFSIPRNGAWFTASKEEASGYAIQNDSQKDVFDGKGNWKEVNTAGRVIPVFLNARKIADFNSSITEEQKDKLRYATNYKKLQGDYFSSIFYSNPNYQERYDAIDYTGDREVIVIYKTPEQIKSAIGNTGTFSPTDSRIQFQIVGEKGLQKQAEKFQDDLANLAIAKSLKEENTSDKDIKRLTGWEQVNGEWVQETPDISFIENLSVILGQDYKLKDIVKPTKAIEVYEGDTIVRFNNTGNNSYNAAERVIELDYRGYSITPDNGTGNSQGTVQTVEPSPAVRRSLIHEYVHKVQAEEGFFGGGSPYSVLRKAFELAGIREGDTRSEGLSKLNELSSELKEREDVKAAKFFLETGNAVLAQEAYRKLAGEVAARAIENKEYLDTEAKINSLIEEYTDVSPQDRLYFSSSRNIRAELSLPAYDPRPNESRDAYISRMKEEIEANMLGANAESFVKEFAQANNKNPETFWQQVKQLISDLSQWLANKLGFKALTPEQAMNLTTKEVLDRATASILKGEFDIKNVQSFLDSRINLTPLYSQEDVEFVNDNINACR